MSLLVAALNSTLTLRRLVSYSRINCSLAQKKRLSDRELISLVDLLLALAVPVSGDRPLASVVVPDACASIDAAGAPGDEPGLGDLWFRF